MANNVFPPDWDYPDLGCELAPSCLHCPLPRCRYDDTSRRPSKRRRDEEIWHLWAHQGHTVSQLAARFGLSRRSVHRILRKGAP